MYRLERINQTLDFCEYDTIISHLTIWRYCIGLMSKHFLFVNDLVLLKKKITPIYIHTYTP